MIKSGAIALPDVISSLGLEIDGEMAQVLRSQWAESQASRPAEQIFFLAPDYVSGACTTLEFPEAANAAALATAERVAADPALRALAWHFHHCFAVCQAYPEGSMNRWPNLATLGELAGMFYVLVLLSAFPRMQAVHRARSIPPEVVQHTLLQIRDRLREHHAAHGVWGLVPANIRWFRFHVQGELYRLGRLQYQFGPFNYRLRAFRHRRQGTVLALSEGGVGYLRAGQLDGSKRVHDVDGKWVSQLTFTDSLVTGHPILPDGRALKDTAVLARCDWQEVLSPGDPVLHIHIPAGEPMVFDKCGESLGMTRKFFSRHFPDRPVKAICCGSWLLDAQLEDLLPPESNMVRFQKEMYLFPLLTSDFSSVKGVIPVDLDQMSCQTSLERAVLEQLKRGQLRARAGGCFLLPEDLNWGSQVYRRQKWPF